ncbi:DUF3131 domain-containing protein [Enterobacter roggenkampii]|uniref:DUF3131 domain-containing protein n=1 Tax=Enterobacter roggenkampii TaxID=1812935 RepID=UPI002075D06E|nr:DUF3131 domain-containing protein [Enterobacter roggenkampii]MCM7870948.1 DUF3131 domain-containing protein [Enterobacter roggenkampii]
MKPRSPILFHLLTGITICWLALSTVRADTELPASGYSPRSGELTAREMTIAKNAWQYFVTNYQPTTGLVNAVNKYPSTTMWDSASYLAALTAARELGIIDKAEFDRRMLKFLATLNTLVLFRNELPNKAYNTISGQKVDYTNKPGEIGFSALDIGRMLVWLKIIKERYPEYGNSIDNVVLGWDFSHAIDPCGTLYGAYLENGQPKYVQEGRLGYEEYGAAGFQLWGFSPEKAFTPPAHHVIIAQRRLAVDARDPRTTWQPSLITTLPYMLPGLEFGWEPEGVAADRQKHLRKQAENVWLSQKSRWETDKILTARADFSLPQAPWHIQDTVWGNGYAWNSVGDDGRDYTRFAQVSTKAVFALWALWDTPYTDVLMAVTKHLNDPQKGWYEGRQEATGDTNAALTLSTNATVLEALFFKHNAGPLFDARRAKKESYFTRRVADDYTPVGHCLPGENAVRRTP